ncbi:hypothetical protein ANCDUO_08877 [Ancylostoma duodenale]|uniref:Uncharacterized protein n=1 Tax=Ancylostoma duodenale TaxID=51022 RepID=A0A0C2CVG4_9BILA|nr:hypothetical protein ANCDUO_08877 [Ancylostoma duodenale]
MDANTQRAKNDLEKKENPGFSSRRKCTCIQKSIQDRTETAINLEFERTHRMKKIKYKKMVFLHFLGHPDDLRTKESHQLKGPPPLGGPKPCPPPPPHH